MSSAPQRHLGLCLALPLVALALAFSSLALGCGAQNRVDDYAEPVAARCPSITSIAPVLADALNTSSPDRLLDIVERYGLTEQRADGLPSPLQSVFWMILRTLNDMGADIPEPGAPEGQRCNDLTPPPATDSNRLCEARRLLKLFIHEGAALDSLELISSVMRDLLDEGKGDCGEEDGEACEESFGGLRVGVADVLAIIGDGCGRRDVCDPYDLFDLIIGFLGFLEPTADEPDRPHRLLDAIRAPITHPWTEAGLLLLKDLMTTDAWIAFVNLIIDNIMILPTEGEAFAARYHEGIEVPLNAVLTSAGVTRESEKYGDLRQALDVLIGGHEDPLSPHGDARPIIYDLLDPAGPWKVLGPLQGFLYCWRNIDPDSDIARFVLELDAGEGVSNLGWLVDILEALIAVDDRIAMITFTRRTLQMMRADAEGTFAIQRICAAFLDDTPDPRTFETSIEVLLPGVREFFATDTLRELFCLLDAFLYGCSGGPLPACEVPFETGASLWEAEEGARASSSVWLEEVF